MKKKLKCQGSHHSVSSSAHTDKHINFCTHRGSTLYTSAKFEVLENNHVTLFKRLTLKVDDILLLFFPQK